MKLDVSVVAGRRPELLLETLESFSGKVFCHHEIQNVFINIDPIFGDESEAAECVEIAKRFFVSPTIFSPSNAGFGAAVKRLWSATRSEFLIHLEDDWLALEDIGSSIEACFGAPNIQQVSFHTANQNWNISKRGHLHRRRRYVSVLGIKVPTHKDYPKFTTSPSIIRGDFARMCGALMNPLYDPEKQFYSGVNLELEHAVSNLDNYIFSPRNAPVILDTGRLWREQRSIAKNMRNGTSYWESPSST